MIKVKYCGLKTTADVRLAIDIGVDAIGLVFVKKSPRYVEADMAKKLISLARKAKVTTVALFADQTQSEVAQIVELCQPDVLQFHGSESATFCEQFSKKYWKAIPMLTTVDYLGYMKAHPNAAAFLLDAYGTRNSGGSGKSFEWFKFPATYQDKMILAGGINIDNIEAAIAATAAQYIDTSSGIERHRGVKSHSKMKALLSKINQLNRSIYT